MLIYFILGCVNLAYEGYSGFMLFSYDNGIAFMDIKMVCEGGEIMKIDFMTYDTQVILTSYCNILALDPEVKYAKSMGQYIPLFSWFPHN